MRVVHDVRELNRSAPTILTIGAFDGVHRGHQFLMRQVIQRARDLEGQSMVLTFDPRPQVVLRPGSTQLTGAAEKERLVAAVGPDVLAIVPFNEETAHIPAGDFLATLLDHVNLSEIWIGADFAFGYQRQGTVDFLINAGQHAGFAVHVVPRQALDGLPISSTAVRTLVEAGDVAAASQLLGHFYSVCGPVVRGFGRGGRDLGYPTANVAVPDWQLLPATGIYAAYVRLDGETLPAAVSVGYNPVFGGTALSVEAHILDFDRDVRDRQVCVDFVARLRDEQNFGSVADLIAQMDRDVARTRQILAETGQPGELILQP